MSIVGILVWFVLQGCVPTCCRVLSEPRKLLRSHVATWKVVAEVDVDLVDVQPVGCYSGRCVHNQCLSVRWVATNTFFVSSSVTAAIGAFGGGTTILDWCLPNPHPLY